MPDVISALFLISDRLPSRGGMASRTVHSSEDVIRSGSVARASSEDPGRGLQGPMSARKITSAGVGACGPLLPPAMYHGNSIRLLAGAWRWSCDRDGELAADAGDDDAGNSHIELANAVSER